MRALAEMDFCDLFRRCMTLTFDLLTPKVDYLTQLTNHCSSCYDAVGWLM